MLKLSMSLKRLMWLILFAIFFPVHALPELLCYNVRALGMNFAKATIRVGTGTFDSFFMTLDTGGLADLIHPVHISYFSLTDSMTGLPVLLEKRLDREGNDHHYNIFLGLFHIGDGKIYLHGKDDTHTLFSIIRLIGNTLPQEEITLTSVSCDTLWQVRVSRLKTDDQYVAYRLTFKNISPFYLVKSRYDDILLKELFWNSGSAVLYFDHSGLLTKAVLESFTPDISIALTERRDD